MNNSLMTEPSPAVAGDTWERCSCVTLEAGPETALVLSGYSVSVMASGAYEVAKLLWVRQSMTMMCESLPAHRGMLTELAATRSWMWIREVEKSLNAAWERNGRRPVLVIGESAGAAVAAELAARNPDKVRALMLLAVGLRLRGMHIILGLLVVLMLYYVLYPLFFWLAYLWVPIPCDRQLGEREHPCYESVPLITTSTLLVLQWVAWYELKNVRCRTLLVHGACDGIIEVSSTDVAFSRLKPDLATKVVIAGAFHTRRPDDAQRFYDDVILSWLRNLS